MGGKSIQELEDELRIKKMQEHEKRRLAALTKKENFRKENGVDVYTSDDYCGMGVGDTSFYYGYEVTQKGEWCFTATIGDKEVLRLRTSQLWGEDDEEPFFYLLGGIAQFLKTAHPKAEKDGK